MFFAVGHKNYLVGCYGYVYSHSNQKLNDKRKGIKFKEGDVIQFEYIEKKLKIANESTTIEL